MIRGLPFEDEQEREFCRSAQFSKEEWGRLRKTLSERFLSKTAEEWEGVFEKYDTCITAVRRPFKSGGV